jgi:hypothetical protein
MSDMSLNNLGQHFGAGATQAAAAGGQQAAAPGGNAQQQALDPVAMYTQQYMLGLPDTASPTYMMDLFNFLNSDYAPWSEAVQGIQVNSVSPLANAQATISQAMKGIDTTGIFGSSGGSAAGGAGGGGNTIASAQRLPSSG